MSNLVEVRRSLLNGCEQYGPRITAAGMVHLEKLGLYISVRELNSMQGQGKALFLSEVQAALSESAPGIVITCVALAEDMSAATRNAMGQWVLGVLPVLALWREQHSCLATDTMVETKAGRFHMLAGPMVMRNLESDEGADPTGGFADSLKPLIQAKKWKNRVHWIELFSSRMGDGGVDATCRLNNRDWSPGKQVLLGLPQRWPASTESIQTCRQFQMLIPADGDRQALILPTFFERLLGRA